MARPCQSSAPDSSGFNPDPAVAVTLIPIEAAIDLMTPEDVLETGTLGMG